MDETLRQEKQMLRYPERARCNPGRACALNPDFIASRGYAFTYSPAICLRARLSQNVRLSQAWELTTEIRDPVSACTKKQVRLVLEDPLRSAFDEDEAIALPRRITTFPANHPYLADITIVPSCGKKNLQACRFGDVERERAQ